MMVWSTPAGIRGLEAQGCDLLGTGAALAVAEPQLPSAIVPVHEQPVAR